MTKTVYAFDTDSLLYLGPVLLDDSDLSPMEPGVHLIPGNCLEDAPPAPQEGKLIVNQDGAWVLVPLPPVTPPPPAEPPKAPSQITMRQARLALLGAGRLADVDAAIATLPSPQRETAQIEWNYAAVVERDSALVALLSTAVGLSQADLDSLFMTAAAL